MCRSLSYIVEGLPSGRACGLTRYEARTTFQPARANAPAPLAQSALDRSEAKTGPRAPREEIDAGLQMIWFKLVLVASGSWVPSHVHSLHAQGAVGVGVGVILYMYEGVLEQTYDVDINPVWISYDFGISQCRNCFVWICHQCNTNQTRKCCERGTKVSTRRW